MIKDILVNLSYGTSQDGVSNYALSVAETFAHTSWGRLCLPGNGQWRWLGLPTNYNPRPASRSSRTRRVRAAAFDEAMRRTGVQPKRAGLKLHWRRTNQFAHIARRFDLSVIGQFERDRGQPTRISSLGGAIRIRKTVLNRSLYSERSPPNSIMFMVCWDGSRAAARAVGDAMPVSYPLRQGEYCCCGHSECPKSIDLPGADMGPI